METFDFIKKHAPWVFSGVGTAIAIAIYKFFVQSNANIFAPIVIGIILICAFIILLESFLFLRSKDFGLYVKSKFRESFYLLLGDKQIPVPVKYKYDSFKLSEKYKELTYVIKDFICYNQGALANYSFVGGRLHKKIKEEVRLKSPNNANLKRYCKTLIDYLFDTFMNDVMAKNHDYIMKYFEGRSQSKPRLVIKGCNNNKMVDIFRVHNEYFTEFLPEDNSGFEHVHRYGTHYLCNDIPQKAYIGEYHNPRLSNYKVREYIDYLREHGKEDDPNKWIDCWTPNSSGSRIMKPSFESCYKSTLIIPMTLLNNKKDLADEFRSHFRIPSPPLSDEKIDRAIYGFLCFDHTEVNYFIEELDVNIGYVFADILSLYLIDLLNYTVYSDTFKQTVNMFPDLKADLGN